MSSQDNNPATVPSQTELSGTEDAHEWSDTRQAVFARDRFRCQNCLADGDIVILDPDHGVPRGAGGADRRSNITAYCRRCHLAKHGEGIAPTAQFESTQRMTDREFYWFEHFAKEMLPKLAQIAGVQLNPMFGLEDKKAWHLPIGDLHNLDVHLNEYDIEYTTYRVAEYM